MSGDVNSTMDDHIYYDNKLNLKKAGANTFFFQNHIVYAYINNERHVVTIELKPPSWNHKRQNLNASVRSNLEFSTKNGEI